MAIAWWMGGSQHGRAASALRTQLIPWIEKSSLSDVDRKSIIEQLDDLVIDMETEHLTTRQLSRLNFRLSGAPIFQWGAIETIEQQALHCDGLSEAEKVAISTECDRLLRTVLNGRVAMEQLEFALQQVTDKEKLSGRLTAHEHISAGEFQEFLRRIGAVSDRVNTSKEPLEKSPSEVFRMMIDDALSDK